MPSWKEEFLSFINDSFNYLYFWFEHFNKLTCLSLSWARQEPNLVKHPTVLNPDVKLPVISTILKLDEPIPPSRVTRLVDLSPIRLLFVGSLKK